MLSVIVSIVITLLLLLVAEGGIRLRQWLRYGTIGHFQNMYLEDKKHQLKIAKPNFIIKSAKANIKINSLGFRGPDIIVPKPEGSTRLLFIGGSTTFCAEVSNNEMVWPHIVSNNIKTAYPKQKIDYINGGMGGYRTATSIRNLKYRLAQYKPDVIVIYHATNDLSHETRLLGKKQGVYHDGMSDSKSWMAQHSTLWYLIDKNLKLIYFKKAAQTNTQRLKFKPEDLGATFYSDLTELVKLAKNVAKMVVVPTFSSRIREEQSNEEKLEAAAPILFYMPFMTPDGLIQSYSRFNEIIRQVVREQNVLLVEGENNIPGDANHFKDTVHFSDKGSILMAERVSQALLSTPQFNRLILDEK